MNMTICHLPNKRKALPENKTAGQYIQPLQIDTCSQNGYNGDIGYYNGFGTGCCMAGV